MRAPMKINLSAMKVAGSIGLLFLVVACGVKGDPQPPQDLPELGRGRPSFSGATKGIDLNVPPPTDEREQDENQPKKRKQ